MSPKYKLLDIVEYQGEELVIIERFLRKREYSTLDQEGYLYRMTWMLGENYFRRSELVCETNMPTYSRSMSIEEGLVHPNEKVRLCTKELSNAQV